MLSPYELFELIRERTKFKDSYSTHWFDNVHFKYAYLEGVDKSGNSLIISIPCNDAIDPTDFILSGNIGVANSLVKIFTNNIDFENILKEKRDFHLIIPMAECRRHMLGKSNHWVFYNIEARRGELSITLYDSRKKIARVSSEFLINFTEMAKSTAKICTDWLRDYLADYLPENLEESQENIKTNRSNTLNIIKDFFQNFSYDIKSREVCLGFQALDDDYSCGYCVVNIIDAIVKGATPERLDTSQAQYGYNENPSYYDSYSEYQYIDMIDMDPDSTIKEISDNMKATDLNPDATSFVKKLEEERKEESKLLESDDHHTEAVVDEKEGSLNEGEGKFVEQVKAENIKKKNKKSKNGK